ncbi:MAG: protease pro-enzyme activation domain-containing protein [Frankiaceae bacterium]
MTALGMALGTAGAANAAPSQQATLSGSVPSWATSAAFKGAAAGSDHVGFRVYLGWRGGDAAANYALAVSTPGNANYRHFLSPSQFRAQYAPTQADVQSVQNWLHGAGFTVDYTPQNNHYVAAEGTVEQASAAFGAGFGMYAVDGQTLRAPEQALSIPASLASVVQGVVGLDQSSALVHTDAARARQSVGTDAPPSSGFRNSQPCSAYWAEKIDTAQPGNYPYAPCGYVASQLRGAYGVAGAVASGNDGSGVTVGIIDAYASPTIVDDANTYSSHYGLPQLTNSNFQQNVAPGTYRVKDNNSQSPSGWYGEETLDIEAVHSMAPGADILYVSGPNNYQDLDAALNHVVDKHLADIVSNSYGWSTELLPNGYVKPYNDIMIQAAAEGIGVYFSSGDAGDETGGSGNPAQATPDWPAVSPWATAVGGTALAVGASNDYLFETGWETGRAPLNADNTWGAPVYTTGSGGGTSRLFAQPSYQAGVVPNALATAHGQRSQPMRVIPDVAMLGDPNTGFRVGQTQTFSDGAYYDEYRIGGTSLSSPLLAGVMALAEQRAGAPLGFANPALYQLGAGALHDIVQPATTQAVARVDFINSQDASGGLRTTLRYLSYDQGLTIHAAPGYDDVTGRGTPTGEAFLNGLASLH